MNLGDERRIGRDLERLWTQGVDPTGDGDLLERFRTGRDEAAFETLVMRHGPMVRGVCRRFLRDPHDADDAFQATFLVLARKGAGLRDPDRLGPWLYGVASRVAAKARSRSARRRTQPLPDDFPAREDARADWSDVAPILDAEVSRLPAAHREVLIHCLLGGVSEREASRRLGCPVGTIKSRLSRAKDALRTRLVRRGVAPSTALAAMSSVESFASPVSLEFVRATMVGVLAKAGSSPAVVALAQGVAPNMLSRSLVLTFALLGVCGAVGLTTTWTQEPPSSRAGGPPVPAAAPFEIVAMDGLQRNDQNLKLILLAVHQYVAAAGGNLPTAAISDDQGRPLLSWRVEILPFLGENELYSEFHLDESWDSPHNSTLISRMPAVYQTPGSPTPEGMTRVRGFSGSGMMFDPQHAVDLRRGVDIQEVADGTSDTALLAVSSTPIEWTRPGELPLLPMNDQETVLDSRDPRGLSFGMVDGSILHIPAAPNRPTLIRQILTRAGGERIVMHRVNPRPSIPHREGLVAGSSTGAVLPSPVLQERLQRIEDRLEKILQRLDAIAPEAKP